ncbi:MAG: phenylacetate--CoA ligase family protein [Planctomycetota bacterium]
MNHPRWDTLERPEQERLQIARLREFLRRQLLPFHPFYRELFQREGIDPEGIRSIADLAAIPFTDKSKVAPTEDDPDRPRSFVLQPTEETLRGSLPLGRKLALGWRRLVRGAAAVKKELGREYRPVQVFFTTGRTALPTSFFLTPYDLRILEIAGGRIAEVVGVDPGRDRLVSLFPYAPHLAFWQVQAVGVASGTFSLQTGGGKVMGSEGILRAISKVRPSTICGIPGYVYHLLRQAVEARQDLSSIEKVFLGGDRIVGGFREKLVEILKEGGAREPRIFSVLGFTESRKCWAECSGGEDTGFHTYPDLEIFEVVDPESGEPVPDGETGELVYTPIDGRGSLVLRYRTGDIVNGGITREPCPACGRTVPRFSSDLSRSSNVTDFALTKIKGSLVNLNLFADILSGHGGVDEWQLVIQKRNNDPYDIDELVLAIAPASGVDPEELTRTLGRHLMDALEVRPTVIRVLKREEILELIGMETQLKESRIIDLRGESREESRAACEAPVEEG